MGLTTDVSVMPPNNMLSDYKLLTINRKSELLLKILLVAGSVLMGIVFAGAAAALEFSKPVVICCGILGLCSVPVILFVKTHFRKHQLKAMSREEALRLLNVPPDKANDMSIIQKKYEGLIERVNPKINLRTSPLRTQIDQLLTDIRQAYAIANQEAEKPNP